MEHASEIGAVVKVLPLKFPPQPLTLEMVKPAAGVTVNVCVWPSATVTAAGDMVPPPPATVAVTWCPLGLALAPAPLSVTSAGAPDASEFKLSTPE